MFDCRQQPVNDDCVTSSSSSSSSSEVWSTVPDAVVVVSAAAVNWTLPPFTTAVGYDDDGSASTTTGETAVAGKPWSAWRQPIYGVALLSVAYMVVAVVGVVNNGLVISVVYGRPAMRTVTNYFLVNLATADILVCVCVLPITLVQNIYTGRSAGRRFRIEIVILCVILLPVSHARARMHATVFFGSDFV